MTRQTNAMARPITAQRFQEILRRIGPPGARRRAFLQAHCDAPGKTSTATHLAHAAGYTNWRALNLQYGMLAKQIADALDMPSPGLGLLVEFNAPNAITNEHWLLTMRSEFFEALRAAQWVTARDTEDTPLDLR